MGTNEKPKPSLFRRFLRSIRSLVRDQGDINERRNAAQADAGKYGTYGTGDRRL